MIEPGKPAVRSATIDLNTSRASYLIEEDTGLMEVPHNAMRWRETRRELWQVDPENPSQCTGALTLTTQRRREAWQAETVATVNFSTTKDSFDVTANVTATTGEQVVHSKDWAFSVPRKLV